MKKTALSTLLALALCMGLAAPALAAQAGDTSIVTSDGYTYILSNPIVAVESWEHDGNTDTVYVIPKGTVITVPDDFDSYSLLYYTPPYADNTGPAGLRGNGSATGTSMDFIDYMYTSYLTMFQGVLADYEPAAISRCVVGIVHYAQSGANATPVAQVFFRNAGEPDDTSVIPQIPAENIPSVWATEAVAAAIEAGLVPESLQGDYRNPTTRAEFCALAVALYQSVTGLEIEGRTKFDDTDDVNVEKMAYIGVVNGVGDNKFAPQSALTREQAATMLSRLAAAMEKPLADTAPTFADSGSISSWALVAVGQLQAAGIMGGVGDNTFAPKAAYTREQSITTIVRLLDLIK